MDELNQRGGLRDELFVHVGYGVIAHHKQGPVSYELSDRRKDGDLILYGSRSRPVGCIYSVPGHDQGFPGPEAHGEEGQRQKQADPWWTLEQI